MVDVKRGAMSEKSGTVKYIFQGSLFLHSRYATSQPDCSTMRLAACATANALLANTTYNDQLPKLASDQMYDNMRLFVHREVKTHGGFFCVNARDTRVRGAKANNYSNPGQVTATGLLFCFDAACMQAVWMLRSTLPCYMNHHIVPNLTAADCRACCRRPAAWRISWRACGPLAPAARLASFAARCWAPAPRRRSDML